MISNPKKHPTNFKELRRYLINNGGMDCFSRVQGQIWMITKEGNWKFVCRCLPDLELEEFKIISLKY